MYLTCPRCSAHHEHPYIWCQGCDYEMNPSDPTQGPLVVIPCHFRYANRDGYTQRELLRESSDYHKSNELAGSPTR